MIKLIIFDLDGTLIDTEPTSIDAWIISSKKFNKELKQEEILNFIGRNVSGIKELVFNIKGNDFPFDDVFEEKKRVSHEIFQKEIKTMPYAKEALEIIKSLNLRMTVATSSSKQRSLDFLDRVGLGSYIEFLVSGEEVINSKPDPEIFSKSMERAEVKPEETIIVEDSLNGIIAARRSGARTVLIPDMVKIADDGMKNADHVFNNLLEFATWLKEEKDNL